MALISTLQDNFDDNTQDLAIWGKFGAQGTETNGRLQITTTLANQYSGYYSKSLYDLTESSIFIQVVNAGDQSIASLEAFPMDLILDSNNKIQWLISGNLIKARSIVGGVTTVVGSTAYLSGTHVYFRIRHTGSTVFWDTSNDGTNWTNRYSEATPFVITALEVDIDAGTYATESSTTTVLFDNLNLIVPDPAVQTVREIAQSLMVSWHNQSLLGNRTFTIGVSTIGGNDIIGINLGAVGSPGNYKYFDESAYVLSLGYERAYNMPTGGLTKGLAEATLDNTSGRFTPRYMGGNSELFTAIEPNKPMIINTGFKVNGVEQPQVQFSGIISDQPHLDVRSKVLSIKAADYIDYFQNRFLDQQIMFTGQRTDQVLTSLATQLGMSTAQYDFDTGINVIPFGLFDKGTRFSDIIHQLVEAENGHFYQDEQGVFKFENRQHWTQSPFSEVQRIIATSQVINAQAPSEDHLINVVEVNSKNYQKQPLQVMFTLPTLSSFEVPTTGTDQFFEFQDPVLALTDPTNGGANSYWVANTAADGSGTDVSSMVSVQNLGTFAKSVKYRFTTTFAPVYITQLVLAGRAAKEIGSIYYREQDDSSVTAYQEHTYSINNDYIQNTDWAKSYARMILNDFSDIENLQQITIMANPLNKLGDLVSWQGRYWRIFDIKTRLEPASGFVQDLMLLQRNIVTYFRIGISTIGGSDKIAP